MELYQWSTSGTDGYLNDKWTACYDGVNRANSTIVLLGTVEGVSEADQKRIKGEALALRAHYHFEAWKIFKNIPYYKEDDVDFRKTNVGTDPFPLMLGDLDEAISLLPESQGQVGRINKWTAKAIKGRIQVYQGDLAGALITLKEVVNSGKYALEANFHNAFRAQNDNGKETVLAYQASVNDGNTNGENGNRSDRLNFPHSGSPFGCCGFHQPTQNLVNAFKVDANGLPFLDGSWNNADVTATDLVDPRLDWTVGRDDVPFLDWGNHAAGWIRARQYSGPYSPKKNIYEQASGAGSTVGWASYQLNSQNLHLLRYADVILLLAECEIQVGSVTEGIRLINIIRERAAAGAQGYDTKPEPAGEKYKFDGPIVVPIDDPGITWAKYKVGLYPTSLTQAEALKALKMERRLELAMEGHRFFDLVRWGEAQTVLNAYIAVEKTKREYLKQAAPVEARHNAYPLPIVQIELSEITNEDGSVDARLVQNEGW